METPINAVVTGATGFLGAALVSKIIESGGRVTALVRKNSPHRTRLMKHDRLSVIEGDLENLSSCREALAHQSPGLFYHLAWEGVGNSYRNDPIQITNINTTLETIRLAHEIGCNRWVGSGSQAEYGPLNRRISEDDPLQPTTLYGAAKASACLLSQIVGQQNDIEIVWARVFSTYGPGDNSGWMLVDVIRQLLAGQKPALTPGEQLWDYLFIDDAIDAFLALGSAPATCGIYNLGSGQSHTIRDIVSIARDLINPSLPLGFGEIPYRPDQVMHLEADTGKLVRDTDWKPKIDIKAGLERLIASIIN